MLATGGNSIAKPALDWDRVTRWTADIAAGNISAITEVFAQHGAAAPGLAWNPVAEQLDAQTLRFLTTYWHGLAGGGLPHFKQIDPIALWPALGYVMLLDVVDGGQDFHYRLYGSMIASISGFDMTGKLLSEHPASHYAVEFALATYRAAVQRREPVYTERPTIGTEQTTRWQRITLPLVGDGGTVSRFLVGLAPIARDGRTLRAAY